MARIKNWDEQQNAWVYSDMYIGNSDGGGAGISAPYEMGDQPPTDKKLFWVDTTEDEAGYVSHNMMTDGSVYGNKLRPATKDLFGGVKADPVTPRQVTPVGIGTDGKLYCDTGLMSISDSGEVISADCVSDYEHEVDCKVKSINLIDSNAPKICYSGEYSKGYPTTGKGNGVIHFGGQYQNTNGGIVYAYIPSGIAYIKAKSPKETIITVLGIREIDGNGLIIDSATAAYDTFTGEYSKKIVLAGERKYVGIAFFTTDGAAGCDISDIIISEEDVPYVPFPTGIKVKRYGSNLIDSDKIDITDHNANYGNKSTLTMLAKGITYTLCCNYPVDVLSARDSTNTIKFSAGDSNHLIFTPSDTTKLWFSAYFVNPIKPDTKLWLVVGDKFKSFLPYISNAYVPEADGKVKGITSLSPDMTILTDTPGVNISATYLADSALYYKKQFEAVNTQLQSSVSYEDLDKALSKGVNSI